MKPPVIDGDLSDPAWQYAARTTTFFDPQTGHPVADQTDAFLLYDANSIYVAFYCHDSQPDKIVARETVRDANLYNDDTVRIEIDPFLTCKYQDYSIFTINALGTRNTQLGGGRANKVEWQGDWEAAAKRVADGWTAEIRIPWAILSYPPSRAKLTMGLNFRRNQQRTRVASLWSDLGPQYFNEREGLWQNVEVPVRHWKPRLSFLPYLLPSGQVTAGHSQFRSGLDARYQPTPELTAVATINPDFASVEGAVESIAFTRSERFVPDERPFFLEGRSYLGLGQGNQIGSFFDSARIQRVDTGVKLYGKIDPQTTIGLLSTIALNQESDFVARVRREISPTSDANLILVQRLAPGEDNTTIAFSPNYRWGKWSVDGQVAQTLGPDAGGMAWTAALNLSDKNLYTTFRYLRVGKSFLDRLGFISFNDYKGWSSLTDWNYNWRHGVFRSFDLSFAPTFNWHIDGRAFQRNADLSMGLTTRSNYFFGLEVYGGAFDQSTDFTISCSVAGNVSNRFRLWGMGIITGKQADLPYTAYGPSFNMRIFKRLDVSVGSFVQSYQGLSQQHIITFNYELSPYRALGGRLVIENSNTNIYLSYRNAGRRGMDTYLLFGDPNAKRIVKKMMLKFVFAL